MDTKNRFETAYYGASGLAYNDCFFLAQRYEANSGYKPGEAECWVCGVAPGKTESTVKPGSQKAQLAAWAALLGSARRGGIGTWLQRARGDMNLPPLNKATEATVALLPYVALDGGQVLIVVVKRPKGHPGRRRTGAVVWRSVVPLPRPNHRLEFVQVHEKQVL